MFKKIFLILILLAIGFSQEANLANTSLENSSQAEIKTEAIQEYAPSFYLLKTVNENVETKDYQVIKKAVQEVEEIYLPRINKIMNSLREEIDYQKSLHPDKDNFESTKDYYDSMVRAFGNNHQLIRSWKKIENALVRFNIIKDSLSTQIENSEFREVEYKLNKLSGIIQMFLGKNYNLKKAVIYFENILPNSERGALTDDNRELITIHNYLAGIYHTLYLKNENSVYSAHCLQQELFHLWSLVELGINDNPKLKEIKYLHLAKTYYDVIDENNSLYQPYLRKIQEKKKSAILKRAGYLSDK